MKKVLLKIRGMHCTSCAMNIDGELEDTEGVVSANTNYAKQETSVEFDEERVSMQQIIKIINTLDYEAKPATML